MVVARRRSADALGSWWSEVRPSLPPLSPRSMSIMTRSSRWRRGLATAGRADLAPPLALLGGRRALIVDEAAQCGESELLPALLAANGGGAGGGGGALRMLVLCGDPRQARHR